MPSTFNRTVVGTQIIGLADVKAKFELLGQRLATNVCRRGLVAGAGVIRDDARPRIPKRTGNLKKNLIAESRGIFKDGSGKPVEHRAVVIVRRKFKGKGYPPRTYAHFVEYGTAPHSLGKGSIRKVFKGSKKTVRQVGKLHPGAKAKPFLRPAFDAKKFEAVRVIERKIREELDKEIKKIAAGGRGKRAA